MPSAQTDANIVFTPFSDCNWSTQRLPLKSKCFPYGQSGGGTLLLLQNCTKVPSPPWLDGTMHAGRHFEFYRFVCVFVLNLLPHLMKLSSTMLSYGLECWTLAQPFILHARARNRTYAHRIHSFIRSRKHAITKTVVF